MCTVHSIHPSTRSFMQSKLNRLPCCKNKYHVILVKFSGPMSVFVLCDKLDFKAQLMSTRYFASDLKKVMYCWVEKKNCPYHGKLLLFCVNNGWFWKKSYYPFRLGHSLWMGRNCILVFLFVCFCLSSVVVTSRNHLPSAEGLKSMICLSCSICIRCWNRCFIDAYHFFGGGLLHEIMKKYLNVFQLFFTLLLNILPAQN